MQKPDSCFSPNYTLCCRYTRRVTEEAPEHSDALKIAAVAAEAALASMKRRGSVVVDERKVRLGR
jgi:hypothetical protein